LDILALKGSDTMKKIIIIIVIGLLGLMLSISTPINIDKNPPTQITKNNIGLPPNAVKKLKDILNNP